MAVATEEELREAGVPATPTDRIHALSSHSDVRVRVLCAKHPNLRAVAVAALAVDPEVAVRSALASRQGLAREIAFRLAGDSHRRVRRCVFRYQSLPRDQLVALVNGGKGTEVVMNLLARHLSDPVFAEQLFAQPRWRWFASRGTFRYAAVKAAISEPQPYAAAMLAANATLSPRSRIALARVRARGPQESIGNRPGLRQWERWAIMLLGRQWAAAAILAADPNRFTWRVVAACRHQRVITRTRAATSSSRLLHHRLSLWTDRWDLLSALAANPRIGLRPMRRLAASRVWAASHVLASRSDVPEDVLLRLYGHPAVLLQLADNPRTPASVIAALPTIDPFVCALAAIHPSLPLDDRLAVAADGDTPAWVLRRLANDPDLPGAERDRLLTWLALGGGAGDVSFDPVTCMGTPGAVGQTHEQAYREIALEVGWWSSLWRTRAAVGRVERLPDEEVGALAIDAHPAVRHVAANFRSIKWLSELALDPMPMVSAKAEPQLRAPKPAPVQRRRLQLGGGTVSVLVMMGVWFAVSAFPVANRSTPITAPRRPADLLADIRASWVDTRSAMSPLQLVCAAGGVSVYVDDTVIGLTVTVQSATKDVKIDGWSNTPDVTYIPIDPITIAAGESRSWVQFGDIGSEISMQIGDNPSLPLRLRQGVPSATRVGDPRGDC